MTLTIDPSSKYMDELSRIMIEEIAREIDTETLNSILILGLLSEGWIHAGPGYGKVIADWVEENAVGEYQYIKGGWYFREEPDATAFLLWWSK